MVRKVILLFIFLFLAAYAYAGGGGNDPQQTAVNFPPSFASYHDADIEGVGAILKHRISQTPFNLVASLIFLAAILHTFLSSKFLYYAHKWKAEYQKEIESGRKSEESTQKRGQIYFLKSTYITSDSYHRLEEYFTLSCQDFGTYNQEQS